MFFFKEYTYILENFITLFIESLVLIFILGLVFYTSLKIGLLLLCVIIVLFIIITKFSYKRLKWYGKNINIQSQKLLDNYLNIFGSIREIILTKKQNFFIKVMKKELDTNLKNEVKSGFFIDLPRVFIEMSMITLLVIVIFIIMETSENFQIVLTNLTILGALLFRAMPSISKIMYQGGSISLKYNKLIIVNNLISNLDDNLLKDDKIFDEKIVFSKLEFKDVSFAYENNKNVLEKLNFKIKNNETIGIYSRSGSGKSTFLDLFCGLVSPTEGNIIVNDNIEIADSKLNLLNFQKIIGYISQNNYLLNDTIKKNITFGLEENEINDKRLEEVINLSKLRNLVDSKDEKFYFQIGDNGKNLSGGQRQRIIIARSIYKNSQILLLDEPTNSLDTNTEIEIINYIKDQFYKKKTLIICSHNWEMLKFCDRIYSINDKKLVQIKNN